MMWWSRLVVWYRNKRNQNPNARFYFVKGSLKVGDMVTIQMTSNGPVVRKAGETH